MFKLFTKKQTPIAKTEDEILKVLIDENRLLQDQVNGLTRQAGMAESHRMNLEFSQQSLLIAILLKYSDEIVVEQDLWTEAISRKYSLNVEAIDKDTTRLTLKQLDDAEPTDEELAKIEEEMSNSEEVY